MRVLLLSWSDMNGGAARAALRLHQALRGAGVESTMLVASKAGDDPGVLGPERTLDRIAARVAARLDQLPLRRYPRRKPVLFSPALAAARTVSRSARVPRDITHLHWVTNGFLRIENLVALPGPLVWSLHDVWALTGGCHYTGGCNRFTEGCGSCPALGSDHDRDLSKRVWQRKRDAWSRLDLTMIASSRWMAGMVGSSMLFRDRGVQIIPNCVDTGFFRPQDENFARQALSLPLDRRVIMFGALSASGDPRKGFHLLAPALQRLAERVPRESVCLAVMGMTRSDTSPVFPFDTRYLGVIVDEARLALAYAAADVLVAPSLEDNLPNMVLEAMSCGTPCVAFDVTGMPDLISHRTNGYLARPFEAEDLSRGMETILEDDLLQRSFGEQARRSVLERFAPSVIARQHADLYESILTSRTRRAPMVSS